MRRPVLSLVLLVLLAVPACSSAYYGAWEAVGVHKREILVDRVEDARDDQEKAKEQFVTALDEFKLAVGYEGGELEQVYKKLQGELDRSEDRAEKVKDRIESVEKVAEALFEEWEKELEQYTSADLRRKSEESLAETRRRYRKMIGAMKLAESKMEPVLVVFRDHVLYLKHNLNAKALASLDSVAAELDKDVAALVRDMETSIDEANAFIEGLAS